MTRSASRLERYTQASAFVAVPTILAVLTATQSRLESRITDFLVLPPFAVVIYLIFRDPFGQSSNLRSIVVLPCLGAAVGSVTYRYLGLTPAGIALDTLCVLALQSALRARMPPALALSVLAMLLRVKDFTYVLGVAESSTFIAILFFLWRRLLISPLVREDQPQSANAAVPVLEPSPEPVVTRVP